MNGSFFNSVQKKNASALIGQTSFVTSHKNTPPLALSTVSKKVQIINGLMAGLVEHV